MIQDAERLLGWPVARISGDATLLDEFTARMNGRLDMVVGDILDSDNRFQWDDSNHSDLPIGVGDLVANQEQYTFDSTWLEILRIEVVGPQGIWQHPLRIIDLQDVKQGYAEYHKTAGTPTEADVFGNVMVLKPAPSYNFTGGLKVFFERSPDYFTSADTTQEPGFAAPFHRLLSLGAALDYARDKNMGKYNTLTVEYERLLEKFREHLSVRQLKLEPTVIRFAYRRGPR